MRAVYCQGPQRYLFPARLRNRERKASKRAIQPVASSWNLVRRQGIGNGIVYRRQRLQVCEDGLQVLVSHIAIPVPGHRRKNGTSGSLMFPGPKRSHEHLLSPASKTCGFIGCEIHCEADAPRPHPRAKMIVHDSQVFIRRNNARRDWRQLLRRRVPRELLSHIVFGSVGPKYLWSMTVVATTYGYKIFAALDG